MSKNHYPYIDIMRLISAILVISIHTYPFSQISIELDFIMTHIIGRIAVPFFFITTAFFLFQEGLPSFQKLKKVISQLLLIYIISILIYIPIQIYNHSLFQSSFEIVKDVIIDGTFYHLWYLPASILGIIIVYGLIKYIGIQKSFFIVLLLYIIGLGGDSYYQLSIQVPFLKTIYDFIFQYCDYTRNGLFFAPMFIWLGAFIRYKDFHIIKKRVYIIGILCLLLMSLEIIILHHYQIPRHDAMTLFLPITMSFFYILLISYQGQRYPLCKDLSLYVYILHPLMIIVTRMIGKIVHLEKYFIQNAFIHFLIVTILSFGFSYLLIFIQKGVKVYGYHRIKNR